MKINEKIMFISPAYWGFVENIDNKKIQEECYNFKSKYSSVKVSNFGGWQSPSNWTDEDLRHTEISKLMAEICNFVDAVAKKWEIDVFLENFWININKKHNFNLSHAHPKSVFSGVFYVKCNENSGNIVFERPDNQEFVINSKGSNEYKCGSYLFPPEKNKLIVFPSHLKHFVEPNQSEEDRISIAFNFGSYHG